MSVKEVTAMVLGGHGDQMVPVVSATTVGGVPLEQLVSKPKSRRWSSEAKVGGGELVNLLGTSAWYAPGAAAAQMVDAICLDEQRVLPSTAYLEGEYGIGGLYMGVPAKLGAGGVEEIVKLKLTPAEKKMLQGLRRGRPRRGRRPDARNVGRLATHTCCGCPALRPEQSPGTLPRHGSRASADARQRAAAPRQGMGLAIAEALVAEGANVAMFARRARSWSARRRGTGALGVRRRPHARGRPRARSSRRRSRPSAASTSLVLNGGGPPPGSAAGLTAERSTAAVELLLVPHVSLVGLCLPYLRASGRGRIVAIESTSVKEPIANLALSNAVRPGVVGWLKTLARELGPDGITVNTIAPGPDRHRAAAGPLRPDGSPPQTLERRSRRDGSALPPRSPLPCASSPPSRPPTSAEPSCRSTAALLNGLAWT